MKPQNKEHPLRPGPAHLVGFWLFPILSLGVVKLLVKTAIWRVSDALPVSFNEGDWIFLGTFAITWAVFLGAMGWAFKKYNRAPQDGSSFDNKGLE